jgi:hypothetical protein
VRQGRGGGSRLLAGELDLLRLTDTDPRSAPSKKRPLNDFQRGGMQPPVEEKSLL